MNKQWFRVSLQSDVAVATRGTFVTPSAPDYLSGLYFLAVSAASLYRQLPQEQAWQLFHSGQVRFGDGLPLSTSGLVADPLPLSWHVARDQSAHQQGQISGVVNLCQPRPQADREAMPRQLRSGYVDASGAWLQPATSYRMKVAIDPHSGLPEDARLYGYESIDRGQHFAFCLSAAAEISGDLFQHDLFQQVVRSLCGTKRIGRSRNAEYGRVSIEPMSQPATALPRAQADPHQLCLWLRSDLVLPHGVGQGSLPQAAALGLGEGELDLGRSYLRYGEQANFNGRYGRYEWQQHRICRGSVLWFQLQKPLCHAQLSALQEDGLGCQRQSGLGCLWVNPPLLQSYLPSFQQAGVPLEQPVVRPQDPLIQWLSSQADEALAQKESAERAELWGQQLEASYRSARVLSGFADQVPVGPSASQWGRVRDLAREQIGSSQAQQVLLQKLFHDENAICADKDAWQQQLLNADQELVSFHQWFKQLFLDQTGGADPVALALLARHAMTLTRRKEVPHESA